MVLCVILGLLLTGWAVKAYRTAHPPKTVEQSDEAKLPGGPAEQ